MQVSEERASSICCKWAWLTVGTRRGRLSQGTGSAFHEGPGPPWQPSGQLRGAGKASAFCRLPRGHTEGNKCLVT